jgi:lipoate-protein ligase A
MACDEALAAKVPETQLPILRLYQWNVPTLSLGYFQPYSGRSSHEPSLTSPCVRRSSGGGALLHDNEWTYSVAVPSGMFADTERLYALFHESFCECLADWGIEATRWGKAPIDSDEFLCFQRRSSADVIVAGRKIMGSAQRRRRGVLMQHGGVLLAQSSSAPELPGLAELTGKQLGEDFIKDWIRALSQKLGWSWQLSEPESCEKELALTLENSRFGTEEWCQRRI